MSGPTVFVCTQIWDGDCIEASPLGVFTDRDKANAFCRKFVTDWSPDEPTNHNADEPGPALDHWEWEDSTGCKLISARVDEMPIDAREVAHSASALVAFLKEIVDCDAFDFERIDDGAFRRRAMRLLKTDEEVTP